MANKWILTLGLSLISAAMLPAVHAAEIPGGVKLHPVQEIVRGNGAEPASLDPQKVEGIPGSGVTKDLFEGLVQQDSDGNIIPAQATHWDISEDNRVFTFHLREGIRWSDGQAVSANDFVYGFQRAVDPATASRYAWYIEIATVTNATDIIQGKKSVDTLGVKAIDDRTFEVTLEQPVPYFVRMLAHQTTFPAPRHAIEKHGDRWTRAGNMVTNGAYTLEQWSVNEQIVLQRNPQYWDNDNTVINKVTFLPIGNAVAELARYKAGEVDVTGGIPLEHYQSLKKEMPEQIVNTPYLSTYYYEFNVNVKPFDDVRVRKALSLAINRDALTQQVLGQGQKSAYTFTPDSVNGFVPPVIDYQNWEHGKRMKEAMSLLQEAGFGPKNPLTVNLLYNTSEGHKKIAVVISQMWKPLGVKVQLENQEWKTFLDTRNQGQFEVARAGWVGDYNEASTMLDVWLSNHGQNKGGWKSDEYDQLLADARLLQSDAARAENYTKAELILAAEMPVIPVYQSVTSRLKKTWVGGYPMNNVEDTIYSKNLYIEAH